MDDLLPDGEWRICTEAPITGLPAPSTTDPLITPVVCSAKILEVEIDVIKKAKKVKKSSNGELEITSLNKLYLEEDNLNVELMGRGMAWLDTGTHDSLHKASSFIKNLEDRQGLKVACPEEIAWRKNFIDDSQLRDLACPLIKSGYGKYLVDLIENPSFDDLYFKNQ